MSPKQSSSRQSKTAQLNECENDLDMHYYRNKGYTELVDITAIQCLVGRTFDRGWWTIIDRSGKLAQAEAFED